MASDDQPKGERLDAWTPRPRPARARLSGRFCRLEPLHPATHADDLFAATAADPAGGIWTYLPYGPFADAAAYRTWIEEGYQGDDPLFFAIVDHASGKARGVAAFLRIDSAQGVIEIGHLVFSPALQRTTAASEAIYLLLKQAFALGYRRCEWKCNALNAPSRAAALRFGFKFEGVFRQAAVVKGCNRDTAWYSMIDKEWPAILATFEKWLAPGNFDATGRQRTALGDCMTMEAGG
ncbi:MAG: GNAT family protein [Rariglobus sp.]